MRIELRKGLPDRLRAEGAALYWEAFGGKLGPVLGPDDRAHRFLTRVLRPDHCVTAWDDEGRLLGLAGFKTPEGSLAGGSLADLRAVYGALGAQWRAGALWALSREVDNDRFLIDGICVARGLRGQGIGTALLGALYAEARARGYASVRLDVVDTNWRARALYERQGFIATRTVGIGALRFVFGFSASITMVRPLPA
jgi:ribosomal protein S18 acetylase RimI-like enzyme